MQLPVALRHCHTKYLQSGKTMFLPSENIFLPQEREMRLAFTFEY